MINILFSTLIVLSCDPLTILDPSNCTQLIPPVCPSNVLVLGEKKITLAKNPCIYKLQIDFHFEELLFQSSIEKLLFSKWNDFFLFITLHLPRQVWNVKTNSPWSVMTLAGHSGEVRCLHLEGNRLVSVLLNHF